MPSFARRDIVNLLDALDRHAEEAAAAARAASRELRIARFAAYDTFRERWDDFNTVSALVEYRLRNLADGPSHELDDRFRTATARMMTVAIQAALHFLRVVAELDALPLAARDLVVGELRSLHEANNRIAEACLTDLLPGRGVADLDVARRIVDTVLKRAPSLLQR